MPTKEIRMIFKAVVIVASLIGTAFGQRAFQGMPVSSLSGTTIDENGTPVASDIIAYQIMADNGELQPMARCNVQTDVHGRFECKIMPSGRYILRVAPLVEQSQSDQKTSATTKPESVYPVRFYPGTEALDGSATLELMPDRPGVAIIRFEKTPGSTVMVRSGVVPKDAVLSLHFHSDAFELSTAFSFAYESEQGAYVAHRVPPGLYTLAADWNVGGRSHHTSAIVTVDGNLPVVEVRLDDVNGSLAGKVEMVDQMHQPLPKEIRVSCGPKGSKENLVSSVSEDGSFSFPTVTRGGCMLRFSAEKKLFICLIRINGRPLPYANTLIDPSPGMRVEIEASSEAGTIAVAVLKEEHASVDIGVIAVEENSKTMLVLGRSNDNRFTAFTVPPGDYHVCAWEDFSKLAYRSAASARRCEKDGKAIEVKSGQPISTELKPLNGPTS
jgi:hypothetical protein